MEKKHTGTDLLLFKAFGFINWAVLILFIIGAVSIRPLYYMEFTFTVKILLACFLIYRFNPYFVIKRPFSELDRRICYSTGFFVLLLGFTDYVNHYLLSIQSFFKPITGPIITEIKESVSL